MRTIVGAASCLVAACSSHPEPPTPPPPRIDAVVVDALVDLARDVRHWFVGDVHMHVSPPDDPADVTMSTDEIAEAARAAHMDFVVLTPHVSKTRWTTRRRSFQQAWDPFAEHAREVKGPTLIPGVEYNNGAGHFTIAGFDLTAAHDDDLLRDAHEAGAFISVNHPFALPTHIPGIPVSDANMSYRVWTEDAPGFEDEDAIEVWNVPLSLANLVSRPGGRTGEARAWSAANRYVHAHHRRLGAVGGTDNHQLAVRPTTWVLADDPSPAAILAALKAGATCVGGPEAGTLRAHGDGDPAGTWTRVGGIIHAPTTTTLTWDGTAHVFVDDVDQGELTTSFTHATGGIGHTYRIEIGASRCSFIYANL
jgi:hypothetical protein